MQNKSRKDYKEIKRRLYNYSTLLSEKKELEIRYKELDEDTGINAINYSNEVKSYGISKTTEQQAIKLVEVKEKMVNFIKYKGIEIERIENLLSALTERERNIIESRYIKQISWESIAVSLYLSGSGCRKIAYRALEKMDRVLNQVI